MKTDGTQTGGDAATGATAGGAATGAEGGSSTAADQTTGGAATTGATAGSSTATGGGEAQTPAPPTAEEFAALQRTVADLTTRASRAEGKLTAAEEAALTPEQRLDRANLQIRTLTVQVAAGKHNIINPADAVALLNWEGVNVHDAAAVDAALAALVKERPYLVKPATAATTTEETTAAAVEKVTTSAGNAARSSTNPQTFTQSQIADREFWKANKPAILKAMAEGRIVEG